MYLTFASITIKACPVALVIDIAQVASVVMDSLLVVASFATTVVVAYGRTKQEEGLLLTSRREPQSLAPSQQLRRCEFQQPHW